MATLTPFEDTTLKALAEYLRDGLNMASEATYGMTAVKQLSLLENFVIKEMPLLTVFRTQSRGDRLELSDVQITYFLGAFATQQEQPGFIYWVARKIAELLLNFNYAQNCAELKSVVRAQYANVRTRSGADFPGVAIFITIEDRHSP